MAYLIHNKFNGGLNCPDGTVFDEADLIIDDDEARYIFMEDYKHNGHLMEEVTTYDDYTDDEIILYREDYFTQDEVDKLNV